MRVVHEINAGCGVVSGDSGPGSCVTVSIHCPRSAGRWPQVRTELIEIEGDREHIRDALGEAIRQIAALTDTTEPKKGE
jgi:hypothetical protein